MSSEPLEALWTRLELLFSARLVFIMALALAAPLFVLTR